MKITKNISFGITNVYKLSVYDEFVIERVLEGLHLEELKKIISIYTDNNKSVDVFLIPFYTSKFYGDSVKELIAEIKTKKSIACILILDDFDFIGLSVSEDVANIIACIKESNCILTLTDLSYKNCAGINNNSYKLSLSNFCLGEYSKTLECSIKESTCSIGFYGFGPFFEGSLAMLDIIKRLKNKYKNRIKIVCIIENTNEQERCIEYFDDVIDDYLFVSKFASFNYLIKHIRSNNLIDIGLAIGCATTSKTQYVCQMIDFTEMNCVGIFTEIPDAGFVHMKNVVVGKQDSESLYSEIDFLINNKESRDLLNRNAFELIQIQFNKTECKKTWMPVIEAIFNTKDNPKDLVNDEISEHTFTVLSPITSDYEYVQSFKIAYRRVLGIAFMFGTYGKNIVSTMALEFRDKNSGKRILVKNVETEKFKDNAWNAVYFTPTEMDLDKDYEFLIKSNSVNDSNAVTLYTNQNVGDVCFKNKELVSYAICFKIIYQR